jgi:molecular chaperone GrpE
MSTEEQREEETPEAVTEGESAVTSDLEARLAEAERDVDQFKRLAQRAQADMINYRNKVRGDQESLQARTAERVARRFIDVADQFEQALAPIVAASADSQWVTGVEAIYMNLLNALKSEGFERFDVAGEQFDPRRHDALLASPSTTHSPNSIIRQLTAGYMRNGEVVRPAQVEIATAPAEPAE